MHNHAPENYRCPFCRIARQPGPDDQACLVYRDATLMALVSLHKWPQNAGHVLVIPVEHYENLYDLPVDLAEPIHKCARAVALAMKAVYRCDGISTRQHNEPAGGQDVWHYHLHVVPRYGGDGFYSSRLVLSPLEERAAYAAQLREQLAKQAG